MRRYSTRLDFNGYCLKQMLLGECVCTASFVRPYVCVYALVVIAASSVMCHSLMFCFFLQVGCKDISKPQKKKQGFKVTDSYVFLKFLGTGHFVLSGSFDVASQISVLRV